MNLTRPALVAAHLLATLMASRSPAQTFVDPCLQCGVVYSSDGGGSLFVIDPATGTSTLLGVTTQMFDIAISADGQLWGLTGLGQLNRIDTCTGTAIPVGSGFFGNGLCGDVTGTFLFAQGPPLSSIDPAGPSSTTIGGGFGPTSPPEWCGGSSGDLAMDGVSGLLFSSLGCAGCLGDTLVTIDPATGDEVANIGCFTDAAAGVGYRGVYGLAFSDDCGLLAGVSFGAYLLDVDMTTGLATQIPITGGYSGTFGLASIPCSPCTPVAETCAPLTQGFWKRQCKGTHPSGEHELLPSYVGCLGRTATFRGLASVDEICDALNPGSTQRQVRAGRGAVHGASAQHVLGPARPLMLHRLDMDIGHDRGRGDRRDRRAPLESRANVSRLRQRAGDRGRHQHVAGAVPAWHDGCAERCSAFRDARVRQARCRPPGPRLAVRSSPATRAMRQQLAAGGLRGSEHPHRDLM